MTASFDGCCGGRERSVAVCWFAFVLTKQTKANRESEKAKKANRRGSEYRALPQKAIITTTDRTAIMANQAAPKLPDAPFLPPSGPRLAILDRFFLYHRFTLPAKASRSSRHRASWSRATYLATSFGSWAFRHALDARTLHASISSGILNILNLRARRNLRCLSMGQR